MGFIKYLGKEIKGSAGKWWYREGKYTLMTFIGVLGMSLVISALIYVPEHIQRIIVIILFVIVGILLLAAAGLATWQMVDWLRDKYKTYKERE